MSTISTTLTLIDNFSSTFNNILNKLKNAQGQEGFGGFASKAVGALSKLHPALNAISSGMQILKPVVNTVSQAFGKMAQSAQQCIQAYQYQSEQELKLETIMKQRMNATSAEIQSIKDFASAQQQLGIYGDEMILQGAQELASFTSNTKAIETLIPAMNNLIAQQYGYSASGQTFQSTADMMGKVLSGQTGALSRLGYVFSEEEKAMLKNGDEMQRAATLAKIITDNVGNMNQALAGTDAGSMQRLSNTIGDLQENIGKNLMPMQSAWKNLINTFKADWLKMMDKVTAAISPIITVFVRVIQSVVNLARAIWQPLFYWLGVMFDRIITPFRIMAKVWEKVTIPILNIITKIITAWNNGLKYISDKLKSIFDPIKQWWQKYIADFLAYMKAIYNVSIRPLIEKIVNPIKNVFNKVKTWFDNIIDKIKEKLGGVMKEIKFEDHLRKIIYGILYVKNFVVMAFEDMINLVKYAWKKMTDEPIITLKNMFAEFVNTFANGIRQMSEWSLLPKGMKNKFANWAKEMSNFAMNITTESNIEPPKLRTTKDVADKTLLDVEDYMQKLNKELNKNTEEQKKNRKATQENTSELKISDEWKNLLSEAAHRQFNLNYNQVTPSINIRDVNINNKVDTKDFIEGMTTVIENSVGATVAYS